MIKTKQDLMEYLAKDKYALGKTRKHPTFFGDEIWKFQIVLRKHEFYINTNSNPIKRKWYGYLHYKMGLELGFTIPCNVFGPGLRINHYGNIVVSVEAKIGAFCDIHQGVNIGINYQPNSAPYIGNNVWIGPGAKLFGKITIADDIMIGANAVVNKSFLESGVTIAGVPAVVVKKQGNVYHRDIVNLTNYEQ